MGNENILRVFYNKVYEYFTLRIARRVFFFALIAVFLCALIVNISYSSFTMQLFLSACTVCMLATLTDSVQTRSELVSQIKNLEYKHFRRLAESNTEITAIEAGPAFSQDEQNYIKRKKREITYTIIVKFVFLIFFVVFLIGGV